MKYLGYNILPGSFIFNDAGRKRSNLGSMPLIRVGKQAKGNDSRMIVRSTDKIHSLFQLSNNDFNGKRFHDMPPSSGNLKIVRSI